MIHVEGHTVGNRHLHSQTGWVNFLECCFSLPLSSQAVHRQLMFAWCHVQPFQTSSSTGLWGWQCAALPELSMGRRGRMESSEKSKGGLHEARLLLWIRLHYHMVWRLGWVLRVVGELNTSEGNVTGVISGVILCLVLPLFLFLEAL